MIDRKHIGRVSGAHTVEVEKGQLRFFAKAIGETNPIYYDEGAARAAGYRSLPAPPTFTFCLDMQKENPFKELDEMGINLGNMLHAEQSFTYHAPICAGDSITIENRVADIYDKKGGALEFVVQEYAARNQEGTLVAEMRRVLVVRN
jgi:acyl dehydratase